MSYRLFLIEDEPGIRVPLADNLRVAGYHVETAEDGESALQIVLGGGFDLIVLDVLLPGKDGVAVCDELRRNGVDTPVLMLTVKATVEDRVRGFVAGADDYVTKPFEFIEVLARIKAILRRSSSRAAQETEQVHEFGDVRVDTSRAAVWRGDERISLSAMEYELLRYFLTHPGEVLPRNRLLREVWMGQPSDDSRTVDVHITGLRKKLEQSSERPRWIRTVRGKGYTFSPE